MSVTGDDTTPPTAGAVTDGLVALDARHLFASNMTRLAVRRGRFLRSYEYDFIQTFVPPLTRQRVEQALAAPPGEGFEI